MDSLKRSMAWDERVYGFEYDLDVFNIAAVSDFNMGAMENKGLNVFNTKYVLARPETATDGDLEGVESVIAHEYFHNWTGNRITCRDWFQLSLKEGLTVFRDQQFSADQGSAAVKRIADVRRLRAGQFAEDAGPLAHPVRPDTYVAIDNFYTATVYQKGAEVVRMLHGQIGVEGFRRGMDLYVRRHDNQAVTIEDFVAALSDGGGIDLSPFLVWYEQAGTPELTAEGEYDAAARRYTLTLTQATAPTPGQPEKRPLPIPVAMGLIGPDGRELARRDLLLRGTRESFVFEAVEAPPVPSLLRGFSAPVRLRGLGQDELRHLAAHDSDPVTRWDSLQEYALAVMCRLVGEHQAGRALHADEGLTRAIAATLEGAGADPAFAAECVVLPSETILAARLPREDPDAVHAVRWFLRRAIGTALREAWRATHARLAGTDPARIDGAAIGARALRNVSLGYLAAAGEEGDSLAQAQFHAALRPGGNMTELLAALDVLAAGESAGRAPALAAFHERWRHDPLVLDKWFAIQAMSPRVTAVAEVAALWDHPDFDPRNPNRARALIASFAMANPVRFHAADGAGYRFLERALRVIDAANGQLAARLVNALASWRRHGEPRATLQRETLERLAATPLSRFTAEKVALALA
jgi:aminopeptidase N